jgi:hypothetical protein
VCFIRFDTHTSDRGARYWIACYYTRKVLVHAPSGSLEIKVNQQPSSDRATAEAFLLHASLVSLFKQEIEQEADEARALRRALLTFTLVVQDDALPATRFLIDYLLLEFPPLADHFTAQHRHPLVAGEDVLRARLQDNRAGLLIRDAFGEQLLSDAVALVTRAEEETE